MNKQTFFAAAALFCLVASLLFLYLLNDIVANLSNFGLAYNPIWAEPYWSFLYTTTALIISSILFFVILIRKPKLETVFSRLKNLERQTDAKKRYTKTKIYSHILHFRNLLDAENFEQLLKQKSPSVKTERDIFEYDTVLSFKLLEPIEDLDNFPEILSFEVLEEDT